MTLWIPFLEDRGQPFEAPDRSTAEVIATRKYGDRRYQVRSAVSVKISDEEATSTKRRRKLRDDE